MSHQEVEVTEFNYNEKLETSYFNKFDLNASVSCTNPQCNNPNIPVKFNVPQFRCGGKESIGRDCTRLFKVKPVS